MKRLLSVCFLLLILSSGRSQAIDSPVKWKYAATLKSATEAELQFTAEIKNDWHLYSPTNPGWELPLEFKFTPSANYQLFGNIKEPKAHTVYDSLQASYTKYFSGTVTFRQTIKINTDKPFKVKGSLSGQACIEGRCTQITDQFEITVPVRPDALVQVMKSDDSTDTIFEEEAEDTAAKTSIDSPSVVEESASAQDAQSSLWWFFLTSIGGGLIGLLMPCVFPMIPMTVSFFMKKEKNGKLHAIVYGLSIVVIFVIFGIILAAVLGPDFANILSTHWIPNVLFAIIFIIFALSLFGYFEIRLPNKWVNSSAKNEQREGFIGTFFMALTLVLVSFSCTLPIAGAVALNAAGGSFIKPIIGMLGFSLGIALPFTFFALFPSLLKTLPKSGGWMNTLKVVLAFVELAFALKFLNVPDQTYHWGILDREVYLAFWIVIFSLLGFYLLGKIRFPADTEYPIQKNWFRFLSSIFVFTFVVYMIPGMFGAPLKAISGWLPPIETQDFSIPDIVREEVQTASFFSDEGQSKESATLIETPHYAEKLHLPYGIQGYFDYDQALRVAKKLNRPIFLDLTGHGCTNCRKVEASVWIDPRVKAKFANELVVATLYVDDKNIDLLPEDYIVNKEGEKITKLGDKNMFISLEKYHQNSQPCYLILDPDGEVLAGPLYSELNVERYLQFLDQGIQAFKSKN